MNLESRLGDIQVLDPDENRHRLGEAWRTQPVVLAFIRHFG